MSGISKGFREVILELWGDESESIKIVEDGDWEVDGKYQNCRTIVKYQDKHYAIYQQRSGSYFTEYNYDDEEVFEVEPHEVVKITTEWRVKK